MNEREKQALLKALGYKNVETPEDQTATNTRPNNMNPSNMRPNNMNPANMDPSNIWPTNMKPTNGNPAKMNTYNMKPANANPYSVKPANGNQNNGKPAAEKPKDLKVEYRISADNSNIMKAKTAPPQESIVSAERLQEAIIWSEILAKPVSRRRKRR